MKTSDCEILIVPGLGNSGPDHWQTRWERKLPTARRVEQADWDRPDRSAWVEAVVEATRRATKPVVIVAHSLGVLAVAEAAPRLEGVRAAFLVAPPDAARPDMPEPVRASFPAPPTAPLPFPSMLIASRNDPYCAFDVSDELAAAWGSLLVDAGESGHINGDSGHGPWPEGLTRFATLLARI